MHTLFRSATLLTLTAAFAAACSDATVTAPTLSPSFKNGGGTAVPPPPPTTTAPTISATSINLSIAAPPLVGQAVNVMVIATSESNDRKAPILSLVSAPTGFALVSSTSVDSPHGGGPGYVIANFAWTPTRDQIGLAASFTLSAATSGGTTTSTSTFAPVADAPDALTGLVATAVGDQIQAHWNPSANGLAPISYTVLACYRNANIRPSASTCDNVGTTTDTQLVLPLVNATPSVAPAGGIATYFELIVTPTDAAGNSGTPGTAIVQ